MRSDFLLDDYGIIIIGTNLKRSEIKMRTILNYLFVTVALLFILLSYFLFTTSGQQSVYSIVSFYASHKADVPIEIKEMHLRHFPYVRIKGIIDEQYQLDIDGFVKNKYLDLRYTLNSECFKSNICTFDDMIRIKGKAKGWMHDFNVSGKGEFFNGFAEYTFTKQKHIFKDIDLKLRDVNSSKLLSLLKQKAIFKGKANADVHFDIIEKKHRVGTIDYAVKVQNFYGIETDFHTNIHINDKKHTFILDVTSADAVLSLKHGTYDQNKKYAHAEYTFDVKKLSALEKLLGDKYPGAFHARGEMYYDQKIHIDGLSSDLGGNVYFAYDTKTLKMLLDGISFSTLMERLNQKPIADANMSGDATYDFQQKTLHAKTKLKNVKIRPSKLTKNIQKKFAIDLNKEVFDNSTLEVLYKDKSITSNLKLANKKIHFILTDAKLNAQHNVLDTHIDIKIPKHSAKGKLYASINKIGNQSLNDVYLNFDGLVEKHYSVKLDGLVSEDFVNMGYKLSAKRLPSHICTIVDDINLSGQLSGPYERLHVAGNGLAMEGKVNYSGTKTKDAIEDLRVDFQDIHALKLFTLLGLPEFPNGKANVRAQFDILSETKKKGHLTFNLHHGKYETLPLELHADFNVNDALIIFTSNAVLSTADINITKGTYNLDTNTSTAFYQVQTDDLAPLKPLIGKYMGPFNSSGEISYKDKNFQIRGLSNAFGGMIDYLYKENDAMLYIDLEKVSLYRFMRLFPYPKMLDAQVVGNINYDYNKETLLVKTKLNNTKFLDSDLVEKIYDKSGVNLHAELFTDSSLSATYHNKILHGNIMLKNDQSHFYLTNTQVDEKHDLINAYFDIKMQGQEFSGKIYGSLKKPKINLNMQKLIRYQMDKQLDTYMGKSNRKMMESMPMGDVAKDVASEMGAGFMGMFF